MDWDAAIQRKAWYSDSNHLTFIKNFDIIYIEDEENPLLNNKDTYSSTYNFTNKLILYEYLVSKLKFGAYSNY